jgi:hypothetical protein
MAKLVTDHLVIAVSKIARDSEADEQQLVSDDVRSAIEQVVAELVGDGFVVEIKS